MQENPHPPKFVQAVELALSGAWDASHQIVQDYHTPMACWIHAVLHKMEPDAWNSRYWYARSGGRQYEDYTDATAELQAILAILRE